LDVQRGCVIDPVAFLALHILLAYRAETVEVGNEGGGERTFKRIWMQHVTSRRKVEGQDFVESIHPAPSPDQLRKA